MFTTGLEVMKDIKKRLKVELKDQALPFKRREEILSQLYFIDVWVREKEKGGFYKKEFKEMCEKAGVRKESLCETIFTRQFKK